MGGKSTSTQTSQSTTQPWSAAQPLMQGLLNQLGGQVTNAGGLSENEAVALSRMTDNANAGNPFTGLISGVANNLFTGGNAGAQAPNISANLDTYRQQLTPFASGSMVGNNTALKDQLSTISNDVQNRINGMFAGAGRDLSGANVGAVARGIAEGTAPVIAGQYNQDINNQINAANALYGAGNTTAGLLTGINQQTLANQQAAVPIAQSAYEASQVGPQQLLEAEAIRRGIPLQNLGLLAQIGVPIASLGSESSGTSTGTQKMSGAQQFGLISGGLNNMGKFLWG